ncbi:MAG TPA: F0F1 ATP synthase subunit B [Spirochaetota bacterium]|nr:F0F1 ATP synthase subunit B [Spirochaetota bacterium]
MEVLKEGLLKVDPGLLLWTIITFLVLLLILWKAAWKPIVEALDARAEKVRGDIESAEKNRLETERLLSQHRDMMGKSKEEAAQIIAEGRSDAEALKNGILEKANGEAKDVIERAKREISMAKDKALSELKSEVVALSTEIASKVIAKNLNPDDQKAFIEEALTKIRTVQ